MAIGQTHSMYPTAACEVATSLQTFNLHTFTNHSTSRYHADVDLQGMVLSAINGVGLALVIPNAQSITADYYDELDRGKAFGALYMTSALGGAVGSLYATNQGR